MVYSLVPVGILRRRRETQYGRLLLLGAEIFLRYQHSAKSLHPIFGFLPVQVVKKKSHGRQSSSDHAPRDHTIGEDESLHQVPVADILSSILRFALRSQRLRVLPEDPGHHLRKRYERG